MTEEKLDAIEQRQIRMEHDIQALIEQVGILITRGAEQADARFPSSQQKFGVFAAGIVASPAGA